MRVTAPRKPDVTQPSVLSPLAERCVGIFDKMQVTKKKNPFFWQSMGKLPEEERRATWGKIAAIGHADQAAKYLDYKPARTSLPAIPGSEVVRQPKQRIQWSDEESAKFIDILFRMRLNDPLGGLGRLVIKAMEQMPEHRRKIFSSNIVKQFADQLIAYKQVFMVKLHELDGLKQKLRDVQAAPTREEVLGTLTDAELLQMKHAVLTFCSPDELMHLSGLTVSELLDDLPLAEIIGHVATKLSAGMGNIVTLATITANAIAAAPKATANPAVIGNGHANGHSNGHSHHPTRMAKVVLIGCLPAQGEKVAKALTGRANVDYFPGAGPRGDMPRADIVCVMKKFSSHSAQDRAKNALVHLPGARFILCRGGFDQAIDMIASALDNNQL